METKKICSKCKEEKSTTEFHRQKDGKYGRRPDCRVCCSEYKKRHHFLNKERDNTNCRLYREINIEEISKYLKTQRFRYNVHSAKRRATKKQAYVPWVNDFVIKEIYHLAELRRKVTGINWAVDHIVPLTSGLVCGLHCEANLRIITKSENSAKNNHMWPGHPDPEKDIKDLPAFGFTLPK